MIRINQKKSETVTLRSYQLAIVYIESIVGAVHPKVFLTFRANYEPITINKLIIFLEDNIFYTASF